VKFLQPLRLAPFRLQRFDSSDRAILLGIRWLFFLILSFLFLYSASDTMPLSQLLLRAGLLFGYAVSNLILTWATRRHFSLYRWNIPIFLIDLFLIGLVLYNSIGPDMDLYLMCFVIIYLSTLGRRVRDAFPVAVVACVLYGLLEYYRVPHLNFDNPHLLLRFPFFLIFALFTSYLSQQAEEGRQKVAQMQQVQTLLAAELQKAMAELRDKQMMLMQAEKLTAMGHMAGALAHEIRNPLSVIVGYVEDLIEARPPEATLVQILQAVRRSAMRCQELMTNLLSFARRPREAEVFRLGDVLQETLTLVKMSAKMTQVQCQFQGQNNPLMSARRGEIQQAFINLMSNALDAMPKGGTLTVAVEEGTSVAGPGWVTVTIKDTGVGIPPEVREHLFEPFFTTKAAGKGTGLGLSIVLDIVQSYHGYIEVDSQPGSGTVFTVHLPLGDISEQAHKTASQTSLAA
jgi:signal transduction histidine kinase